MKTKNLLTGALPLLAAFVIAGSAYGQVPDAGVPPSPQMMAKMKAWQKWRQNHKNIGAVQQSLAGLQAIEQDPTTQLTKAQAKPILAVLGAWRTKPVMTDDQARKVNLQLTNTLTIPQIKKLAILAAERHNHRGGGGGQGGGAGRPQGGRPGMGMMSDPRDYNPLNPDTNPFERARPRAKERLATLIAELKQAK